MTAQPREALTLAAPRQPVVHPAVRYGELEPRDRILLLALEAQGGAADVTTLAQVTSRDPGYVQTRLSALAAMELIQEVAGRWEIVQDLRSRVRRDLDASVGARVVLRSENTVRCPAPHAGERVLRSLCREVFAPHVVRPRVPLRQVLDVQAMNSLLDEGDRAFLANGSVHLDVVVEDAQTEQALLALELDGPQHDRSPQLERDARKDRILRVAGLPLLRLWTCEAEPPGEEMLRALLGWRLQGALRDPGFRQACHPALRGALERCPGSHDLGALLGPELLASLLGDGPGARARLATLAQIVADLRVTHNDDGVLQWFGKPRYPLRGKAPLEILRGDWSPDDPTVQVVCRLAEAGGSFFAT